MPTVRKRQKKNGSTVYDLRAFVEEGPNGVQITKTKTWTPPEGMRPTAADKKAEKEAVIFEEHVRIGVVSIEAKMKFGDYAGRVLESADVALKTRGHYEYLLPRINQAIGHIPLEKLRKEHIQKFLKNLREPGVKKHGDYAVSMTLGECRKAANLTRRQLSELSGVSATTIAAAESGKNVYIQTAHKLCKALELVISKVFTVESGNGELSARTIRHHLKLIKTILNQAVETKILQYNVADKITVKVPKKRVKHLDDVGARNFLALLLKEPDIRIKAALVIDLFTGVRRGELCGLTWPDIIFDKLQIRVCAASQYMPGHGIYEVDTKNDSSYRSIDVSPFVMDVLKEYRRWWEDYRISLGDYWKDEKKRLFIQADGKPLHPDTINSWLTKFCKRKELPHIHPHGLRHTYASLKLASGIDLRSLCGATGHAQPSTLLDIYSHVIPSAQSRSVKALDEVLLGPLNNEDSDVENNS